MYRKFSTMPILTKEITPDIKNDMKNDIKKAKVINSNFFGITKTPYEKKFYSL